MSPNTMNSPADASVSGRIEKPEERELTRKNEEFAAIETELAERELRIVNVRAELGAFERNYLHTVGTLYAELDEWKARIAEKTAQRQPENSRSGKAANDARARANQTKASVEIGSAEDSKPFEASPAMKKLYREVARRIHPDLTSDRADRAKRQVLMAEANQAYECADEAKLRKILAHYECSPETVTGEGAGPELVRVIRRISQGRSRLAEIEAELQDLFRSDLFQLKQRVDEAAEHGRDLLGDLRGKVEQQIASAKERLQEVGQFVGQ
ncbi:MAG TPA: J domain-containing protein [Candidatus Acidoferrum sp.]|nr:J domain-containing protein [Candidatus Acidoferrum sp.]